MARIIEIATPLDPDVLLFHTMRGTEEMSRLFEYELELFSLDGEVDLDEVLGKRHHGDARARRRRGALLQRPVQPHLARRQAGPLSHVYHATVRPWLWFLTRTKNYRIFQEKTVPDILKEMFDEHSAHRRRRVRAHRERTRRGSYCVQYNESDFAFVSRLMEHEGIYYFFKHTDGKHTLVIADSYQRARALLRGRDCRSSRRTSAFVPSRNTSASGRSRRELQPGKYALAVVRLREAERRSAGAEQHQPASMRWPSTRCSSIGGDYVERGDGELYARMRIEEVQAKFERTRGRDQRAGDGPGLPLQLWACTRAPIRTPSIWSSQRNTRCARASTKASETPAAEYQLPVHRPEQPSNRSAPSGSRRSRSCRVRRRRSSSARGEIHTDNYGRVKVHFYWDRYEPARRQELVLDPGVAELGRQGLGRDVHPARRAGSDRAVRGRRSGSADRSPAGFTTPRTCRRWSCRRARPRASSATTAATRSSWKAGRAEQHIQLKQTCGNEILMQGKAGEESIKITDHGGNFIHMNGVAGAEFIHICDKYGNEIKLDAVAKFMRLASPTHNSFIEIGKSLVFTTDSDNKELISANTELTALGFKSENIGGLKSEIIVGVKNEKLFGGYIGFGVSYSYKRVKSVENHVNDATFRQRCVGDAKIDSDGTLRLIGGTGDASKVILGAKHAVIKSGTTEIFLAKDGEIGITNTSGSKISMGGGNIWISCDTLNFQKCKKIDFGGATLERGKTGNFFS